MCLPVQSVVYLRFDTNWHLTTGKSCSHRRIEYATNETKNTRAFALYVKALESGKPIH